MTQAKVVIQGKDHNIVVTVEVACELADLSDTLDSLVQAAQARGWGDPTPAITVNAGGGYGGRKEQKSRLVLDTESNRIKLYPAYPLVGVRGDKEASQIKRNEFIEHVREACGKKITVGFIFNREKPSESYYWVGLVFADAIWQADYFKDWDKDPAILPDDLS